MANKSVKIKLLSDSFLHLVLVNVKFKEEILSFFVVFLENIFVKNEL